MLLHFCISNVERQFFCGDMVIVIRVFHLNFTTCHSLHFVLFLQDTRVRFPDYNVIIRHHLLIRRYISGKRELVALLNLPSRCLVMVEWLFLTAAVCDCCIS